jgi:hypothetical protein
MLTLASGRDNTNFLRGRQRLLRKELSEVWSNSRMIRVRNPRENWGQGKIGGKIAEENWENWGKIGVREQFSSNLDAEVLSQESAHVAVEVSDRRR